MNSAGAPQHCESVTRNPAFFRQDTCPILGRNAAKVHNLQKPLSATVRSGVFAKHHGVSACYHSGQTEYMGPLYGNRMPHIHKKAMQDIIDCCSGSFGTIVYACHDCAHTAHSLLLRKSALPNMSAE
jgi:hypothetical protein